MTVANRVIGAIIIQSMKQERAFDEGHKELLATVANQAAVAIENATLYRKLLAAQTQIAETEAVTTRSLIATDFVHRLNNFAGTIPIWVDQAREHLIATGLSDKTLNKCLTMIEEDANGLLRAAERLKSPPALQNVNLEDTLKSLVRQASVQVQSTIQVNLQCTGRLRPVRAVVSELANALWSIMQNGVESMPDGGALTIQATTITDTTSRNWIEIQISDQGIGLEGKIAANIFEPFYSTKVGHMGYGLWRTKNIVERLGGSVRLESTKGVGTRVTVTLPAIEGGD